MYGTGFYKISRIFLYFLIITVFGFFQLRCSYFDKDISCKAKLILTIINGYSSQIEVQFANFEEDVYNPDYTWVINFSDTSALIQSQEKRSFVFNYSWIESNDCGFTRASIEKTRIDANVISTDSTILTYQVYPFDTTVIFQRICENCEYEHYDTLVLE